MHRGTMTNMADQKIKGSDNNFLFIDSNGLLVLRFRLLHDLDVKRINLDADFGPNGNHLRGLYQPFKAICHNFHLIMNTLEDRVDQGTLEDTFLRRYQFHVLGSDDYIYGLILTETGIYTVKTGTRRSLIMVAPMILLSPIKSATKAFSGSL